MVDLLLVEMTENRALTRVIDAMSTLMIQFIVGRLRRILNGSFLTRGLTWVVIKKRVHIYFHSKPTIS
jgi:hypothetical protein